MLYNYKGPPLHIMHDDDMLMIESSRACFVVIKKSPCWSVFCKIDTNWKEYEKIWCFKKKCGCLFNDLIVILCSFSKILIYSSAKLSVVLTRIKTCFNELSAAVKIWLFYWSLLHYIINQPSDWTFRHIDLILRM